MKAKLFFVSLILFYGCTSQSPKISEEDIAKKKADSIVKFRNDSIQKVVVDSIRRISAAKIAYENRPWKINEYTDKFGDPTGEKFIMTYVTGTFTNSATTNEDLWVKIYIEKNIAGLFLHQYSPSDQAEKFIGGGSMYLKNENGEKIKLSIGGDWNQNGGIRIENNNFSKLLSFLKKSPGKIIVIVHDEYSSEYEFSISGDGFEDEFKLLSKK